MSDNPIAIAGGIFVIAIIAIILVSFISSVSESLTENKCEPYIKQINDCNLDKNKLNYVIAEKNANLLNCQSDYNKLITENITKKDFEEIKSDYNIIRYEINTLNQKIDSGDHYQIKIYNSIINKYNISFALNITFALELLSLFLFKQEIILFLINKLKRKKKEENK